MTYFVFCLLVGPGFYPSVIRQFSGDPEQWNVDPSPSLTHTVEAIVKAKRMEQGKKYNLMAKVIPIYGFGILLYIIYIIHKVTGIDFYCKQTAELNERIKHIDDIYVPSCHVGIR